MRLIRKLREQFVRWQWTTLDILDTRVRAVEALFASARFGTPEFKALSEKLGKLRRRQRRVGTSIGFSESHCSLPMSRDRYGYAVAVPMWVLELNGVR